MIHYPIPPHRQRAYVNSSRRRLPITETLAKEVLSLPMHNQMDAKDVRAVVEVIGRFRRKRSQG